MSADAADFQLVISQETKNFNTHILPAKWFTRPTCVVAADLIGKILYRRVTDTDGQDKVLCMRITETEGYTGR